VRAGFKNGVCQRPLASAATAQNLPKLAKLISVPAPIAAT
jgi:hypothetical protein